MGIPIILEKTDPINQGLNRCFPDGNTPFQIIPRLLEESGEMAHMVNHLGGMGVNREKYGSPDSYKLAKEVVDIFL